MATGILIVSGMLGFYFLESSYILSSMSFKEKLLTSLFQSVTCRTAGFNSVTIGSLRESTLFFMIGLMFVGGSPGSIAGGIKTTTLVVVLAVIISKITGKKQITFWKNGISKDTIEKSTTLIILAGLFIYGATFCLLFLNSFDKDHSVISALFEMTSAFSTVGLTTGITATIGFEGKLVTSLVMLIGRLGPLTLISAISSRSKESPIKYAEQNIMIG
jgi:trk system potassium uptake protein TrkH